MRIREVEHSSFTPLVFSASGGMGHEASVFYKWLASLLSDKWNDAYATVLDVDCHFVYCVQQSNALEEHDLSSQGRYIKSAPVALVQSETQFLI